MTIAEVRLANTNLNFNHRYDAWIEYENTFVGFTFLKAIRWRESMGFFETKTSPKMLHANTVFVAMKKKIMQKKRKKNCKT